MATVQAPPCGTSEIIGRFRQVDGVDEQRAGSPFRQKRTFEHLHVVGEIVAGKFWMAKLHHQVRYFVAMKDRERGVGIILEKAITVHRMSVFVFMGLFVSYVFDLSGLSHG